MKLSWDFDQISKLCLEPLVKLNLAPYGSRDRVPGFEAGEVAR
ncbi:hypothetical protein LEP1GSC005_0054 [Leptospira santarosai str. ST188]|nr:hypothetical protein LEP1GSC005_0054 [Leptospira santarosai str. ST188]